MKVELGTEGLDKSWQKTFEPEVDCIQPECDGKARIAFVAHEIGNAISFPPGTKCHYCSKEIEWGVIRDAEPPQLRIHMCRACNVERYGALYVSDMHDNDPDKEGYWLHDACAVAVYFCRKCLNPTAKYNQA